MFRRLSASLQGGKGQLSQSPGLHGGPVRLSSFKAKETAIINAKAKIAAKAKTKAIIPSSPTLTF